MKNIERILSRTTLIFSCMIGLFMVVSTTTNAQSGNKIQPHQIPAETFAALPSFTRPKLSADGNKVAYLTSYKGKQHVVYQTVGKKDWVLIPPLDKGEIITFYWANNEVLLIKFGLTLNRWIFRTKTSESRIISYNTNTRDYHWLGKPKAMSKEQLTSQFERIVDMLPDDPDHILMQLDFKLDGTPSIYKVNINTGRKVLKRRGKGGVQIWHADATSNVRLGIGYRKNKPFTYLKNAEGHWLELEDVDWFEDFTVEGFSPDPHLIYVSGTSKYGTDGVYKLDIETGEIVETVYEEAEVDFSYLLEHPITGRINGVRVVKDVAEDHYFDRQFNILQRSLGKAVPGYSIRIVGRARDKELYLVFAENAQNPGIYFLYNRPERKLDLIAASRNGIDPDLMANTELVSIPVRDGSTIPGYLTKPWGGVDKSLPTVIMPHGGPIGARSSATWYYWAQFIASRGYAVLQPNFRGSGGYGSRFQDMGKKQWGGLMQDDVTDATNWLIHEGIADKDRICIVGASYGGYAALMGAIKEPDLYRCAMSVNGVADLPLLIAGDKKYIGGRYWTKQMGLKGENTETVSPYDRAEEIMIPVLLVAAKDDARVPLAQSKAMHKRLKSLKKESRFVELENGGHSMTNASVRLIMLQETEKFLRKHLKND